jgi:poly-gamma-glutamate synthesis protein (capsule biosynthesis protein)
VSVFLAPPRSPFHFSAEPVPADVAAAMRGVSWRDDPRCPPLSALALLQIAHLDFEGRPARGQLIIAAELVPVTRALFARLWDLGFPIRSMRLIDELGGSDDASMAADNCSGFNFRTIAGTELLSQHALGRAIDINPRENPWLAASGIQPPEGAAYLDRRQLRPGMIVRPGPVVALFDELGWEWGGDWPRPDYHHLHIHVSRSR